MFFILAKGYLSHELGMLGFPAYDRSQLLLGFYKEVQSQGGQTQVRILRGPPSLRVVHSRWKRRCCDACVYEIYTGVMQVFKSGRLGSGVPHSCLPGQACRRASTLCWCLVWPSSTRLEVH